MDYTEKISSSNSLNNQMNCESSISSSQQGVQYPNDNFSLAPSNHLYISFCAGKIKTVILYKLHSHKKTYSKKC